MSDRHYVQMVWVDLDGTLAKYDGWKGIGHIGDPFPVAKQFMEELAAIGEERGFKVGVYTVRAKVDMAGREILHTGVMDGQPVGVKAEVLAQIVRDWLETHKIPFYEVYTGQGKPAGLAYIDDRAVWCSPAVFPSAYTTAIEGVKNLLPGGINSC